jgi:hypothetical protein
MAYVVVRVVICDAFREPDKPYQVLPGGKVQAQGRAAALCPVPGVGARRAMVRPLRENDEALVNKCRTFLEVGQLEVVEVTPSVRQRPRRCGPFL